MKLTVPGYLYNIKWIVSQGFVYGEMVFNLLIIHINSGQFDSFGPDSEDEQEELIHSGTTEDDSEEYSTA